MGSTTSSLTKISTSHISETVFVGSTTSSSQIDTTFTGSTTSSFQIQSISKCLSWRGGGYDKGVYTFEHEDVEFERQLLNPEVYELNVAHYEESPQLLRNAISAQMRSIRTNGDGACGVHALFGSPELAINGGYELFAQRARVVAVEHMGHSLEMLEQSSDIHQLIRDIKTIL